MWTRIQVRLMINEPRAWRPVRFNRNDNESQLILNYGIMIMEVLKICILRCSKKLKLYYQMDWKKKINSIIRNQ